MSRQGRLSDVMISALNGGVMVHGGGIGCIRVKKGGVRVFHINIDM